MRSSSTKDAARELPKVHWIAGCKILAFSENKIQLRLDAARLFQDGIPMVMLSFCGTER
jgi:hypothetical protein